MTDLQIVTGPNPEPLTAFAAAELARYARDLFGVAAAVNARPAEATASVWLDADGSGLAVPDDPQTYTLRRFTRPAGGDHLLAAGGSPAATLWAVYELVRGWGVQFLLSGDLVPDAPGPLRLPDADRTCAPNLDTRCWRLINDFVCGPESWGLAENRRFIDQLAKNAFNEVLLSLWPWQSFVHYEFRGVAKRTGCSWFDFRYPVDEHTVGRELFGGADEFENPDLAGIDDYHERHAAARRLATGIIEHAAARGIGSSMSLSLIEYPLEFLPVIPGAHVARQLAEKTCVPGSDQAPDDPLLVDLARTKISAHLHTYPGVERLFLGFPEHREWLDCAEDAWRSLDDKYAISEVLTLEQALAAARRRTDVHGGADRQVSRVLGDIAMLRFIDCVLEDRSVLARPGHAAPARILYGQPAEELLPILPRIAPPGAGVVAFIDYTARRAADHIEVMDHAVPGAMPSRFIFTLADDNVGVLPQLATGPLHTLATRMRTDGWSGFSTRHWMIGDLDPTMRYLARSCWDGDCTPEAAYRELAVGVCGEEAAAPLVAAWQQVDAITDDLDRHGMGFSFPVPGMMEKHWQAGEPLSAELRDVRERYAAALPRIEEAIALARPAGQPFARYHAERLRFAVGYLDAVAATREGGIAEAAGRASDALAGATGALAHLTAAVQAYASVAADNSDRGAIASINEYCIRFLRATRDRLAA